MFLTDAQQSLRQALDTGASEVQVDIQVPRSVAEKLLELLVAEHLHGADVLARRREFRTSEAAALLGISRPHLSRLIGAGRIPARKVGAHWRISAEAIAEFRSDAEQSEIALVSSRATYADRKPYASVDDLATLTGPTAGTVQLPVILDWTPKRDYDLALAGDRRLLYETVLQEARNTVDLQRYLDKDLLIDLWPDMFLPTQVRNKWERAFPELAARHAQAMDRA